MAGLAAAQQRIREAFREVHQDAARVTEAEKVGGQQVGLRVLPEILFGKKAK